jgi:hypothetical protein
MVELTFSIAAFALLCCMIGLTEKVHHEEDGTP